MSSNKDAAKGCCGCLAVVALLCFFVPAVLTFFSMLADWGVAFVTNYFYWIAIACSVVLLLVLASKSETAAGILGLLLLGLLAWGGYLACCSGWRWYNEWKREQVAVPATHPTANKIPAPAAPAPQPSGRTPGAVSDYIERPTANGPEQEKAKVDEVDGHFEYKPAAP